MTAIHDGQQECGTAGGGEDVDCDEAGVDALQLCERRRERRVVDCAARDRGDDLARDPLDRDPATRMLARDEPVERPWRPATARSLGLLPHLRVDEGA